MSITPLPCHSEPVTDVTGVGIRIFSGRNLRKAQDLCVLETDCHASVYPKGTCFAARTGSQRQAFFYPWDTVPCAQCAFLNTVSGAEMTTRVLSATEPVRNALPPTTECSPITVSPPRMDAPE